MGNVVSSFFSGFGKVIGDIFGSPLDFLAGKSCNSVCGSTWDFICYIENFCVSHLLKMAMVLVLLYIVLLFLYLLHKLGICECVSWSLCRMLWACFASCLSVCDCCCTFLCLKLRNLRGRTNRRRRRRRKLDIEVVDTSSTEAGDEHHNGETSFASCDYDMYKEKSDSSLSRRKRDYRSDQLRKSLRPRSHRIGAGISKDHLGHGNRRSYNIKLGDHHNHNHDHDHNSRVDHAIRVTRTSKFVRKGTIYKGGIIQRRRSRPMEG
ncbi:uncharacterized protein LOC112091400 [Morus notabilis]|uniref:uncharacterized protein LOC112091400 n=1 Tax=Morus notabilis TaxID=981085 RepID=UPI000CED6399|nr:uncharacterized protein LOC112091400 [Morus notabilis]